MHLFLPPALHYEVVLKESRPTNEQGSPHRRHGSKTTPTGPSQERIDTCFQVLGKLIHSHLQSHAHIDLSPAHVCIQMTFWCTLVSTRG